MSTTPLIPTGPFAASCPKCNEALIAGKAYCPNCGLLVGSPSDAALRAYVDAKVTSELGAKVKDSAGIVREVADKVEDVVWTRLKRYTVIIGVCVAIIVALVTFIGLKTYDDLKQSVLKRIEPAVAQVEQRAKAAGSAIDELNRTRIPAVTQSLNAVDAEAKSQRQRVESADGQIAKGLHNLQAAEDNANHDSEQFQQNVAANQAKLDQLTQRSQAQIAQVTTSASNASLSQAYPALGQEPQVLIGNQVLSVKNKKPGEKWVSLVPSNEALREGIYTKEELEQIQSALSSAGYRVFPGIISATGRFGVGVERLGNEFSARDTEVFYFNQRNIVMASDVLAIVAKHAKTMTGRPILASGTAYPDTFKPAYKFIIDDSGLDMQVFLGPEKSR